MPVVGPHSHHVCSAQGGFVRYRCDPMSTVMVRRSAVVGVVLAALAWFVWPFGSGGGVDVVIIGDGSVNSANDELQRRFRQEGFVPRVVAAEPAQCGDVESLADGVDHVVVSFSDWSSCRTLPSSVRLLVEQPRGAAVPAALADGQTVRPASLLFTGADRDNCRWWDTPGPGEARPGLGQCQPDGTVAVFADDELTPAGRERFARLVVEAVK
jgi:hypothetical protein